MSSPFPGMDPYFEAHWGDVHTSLAIYARNHLNKQLPAGLVARVQESIGVEVDDPTDPNVVTYLPDVQVSHADYGPLRTDRGGVMTADEPLILKRTTEPEVIRSLHITTADGGKLVTAIEFLSPSNKIGRTGQDAYRKKQKDILASRASLVEIDMIRAGRHVLAVGLGRIPTKYRTMYKAVVVRGWKRSQAEYYPLPIRAPLPTIKVPLRKTDPDAALDLRALVALAYDDGGYDAIDYRGRLDPDLGPDDAAWADAHLKAAGKRPAGT